MAAMAGRQARGPPFLKYRCCEAQPKVAQGAVPHLKEDQSWDVDWYCSRLSWRASATERHMRMPSSLSGMRTFSIFDVAMKRFTLLMLVSAALQSHRHIPFRVNWLCSCDYIG